MPQGEQGLASKQTYGLASGSEARTAGRRPRQQCAVDSGLRRFRGHCQRPRPRQHSCPPASSNPDNLAACHRPCSSFPQGPLGRDSSSWQLRPTTTQHSPRVCKRGERGEMAKARRRAVAVGSLRAEWCCWAVGENRVGQPLPWARSLYCWGASEWIPIRVLGARGEQLLRPTTAAAAQVKGGPLTTAAAHTQAGQGNMKVAAHLPSASARGRGAPAAAHCMPRTCIRRAMQCRSEANNAAWRRRPGVALPVRGASPPAVCAPRLQHQHAPGQPHTLSRGVAHQPIATLKCEAQRTAHGSLQPNARVHMLTWARPSTHRHHSFVILHLHWQHGHRMASRRLTKPPHAASLTAGSKL